MEWEVGMIIGFVGGWFCRSIAGLLINRSKKDKKPKEKKEVEKEEPKKEEKEEPIEEKEEVKEEVNKLGYIKVENYPPRKVGDLR